MYVRTSTIHARSSALDAGIAYIRDTVEPGLADLDGYIGLSLLADRLTGRCICTTAWQSAEAMNASRPAANDLRDHAAQILGGSPTVDEWEIAALHREHHAGPGACVRVTWARVDTELVERAIDGYRLATIPALQELGGFCSASLMVDRESGYGVASVTFDSAEAMRRGRAAMDEVKSATIRDSGAEVLDECEFDLVLAHLRVPELA
jgi:heme-degrading monooxygenase HmoA